MIKQTFFFWGGGGICFRFCRSSVSWLQEYPVSRERHWCFTPAFVVVYLIHGIDFFHSSGWT